MQIWLHQNITYFYVHNLSDKQVLLTPNPNPANGYNFITKFQTLICGERTHTQGDQYLVVNGLTQKELWKKEKGGRYG
jgi:hypothetical protein